MKATDIENVESAEFKSLMTPELLKLGKVFKQNNYDIRLVGGAVRDLMLGKSLPSINDDKFLIKVKDQIKSKIKVS